MKSPCDLGEFAAFNRLPALAPPASADRRRTSRRPQPATVPPVPLSLPSARPVVAASPVSASNSTSRQQAELDNVVNALDALLAGPPGPHFDGELLALNNRIDAVHIADCTAAVPVNQPLFSLPRAISRARPKLTEDRDYEPLCFSTVHWQPTPVFTASLPAAADSDLGPTAPQSDLSDDCLRDLIELSQDGIRVDWPLGLDIQLAQAVLRARRSTGTVVPLDDSKLIAPSCTASADSSALRTSAESHPPGPYSPHVSPDGATREICARRIFPGTPTCTEQLVDPLNVQVDPPLTTPCTEQASSPRPEPARAGGASRQPITRHDEESACAVAPPAPALAGSLSNEELDGVHSTSRPIRELLTEQLVPRGPNQGRHSALLGSASRAGSVPVRGSAGVFGKKNQR